MRSFSENIAQPPDHEAGQTLPASNTFVPAAYPKPWLNAAVGPQNPFAGRAVGASYFDTRRLVSVLGTTPPRWPTSGLLFTIHVCSTFRTRPGSRLQANRRRGLGTEARALLQEGLSKNTQLLACIDPKTGMPGSTIPDGVRASGQTVDVKDVKRLCDSPQLRRQSGISALSLQKGQIITNERTQVSKTVRERMDVRRQPSRQD
jgi:hypothetical protein